MEKFKQIQPVNMLVHFVSVLSLFVCVCIIMYVCMYIHINRHIHTCIYIQAKLG